MTNEEAYRAGIIVALSQSYAMLAECLPGDARGRFGDWCETVLRWCHGQPTPGWSPPSPFTEPRALDHPSMPRPLAPVASQNNWQNVKLAVSPGNVPQPEPWRGTDQRPAGGMTRLQELRARGVYVEDSER